MAFCLHIVEWFTTFGVVFIPPLVQDQSPPKLSFLLSFNLTASIKMENAKGECIAHTHTSNKSKNRPALSLSLLETFCLIPTRTKTTIIICNIWLCAPALECKPSHLDLIDLQLPLDTAVLSLQAGQPRLDVLISGDKGKVGGWVDIVGGHGRGVPRHTATAILLQAPCVAASSQQPQLPSAEQRLHHSGPQPEDRHRRLFAY